MDRSEFIQIWFENLLLQNYDPEEIMKVLSMPFNDEEDIKRNVDKYLKEKGSSVSQVFSKPPPEIKPIDISKPKAPSYLEGKPLQPKEAPINQEKNAPKFPSKIEEKQSPPDKPTINQGKNISNQKSNEFIQPVEVLSNIVREPTKITFKGGSCRFEKSNIFSKKNVHNESKKYDSSHLPDLKLNKLFLARRKSKAIQILSSFLQKEASKAINSNINESQLGCIIFSLKENLSKPLPGL